MKFKINRFSRSLKLALAAAGLLAVTAQATEVGPLIDVLVQKKIISPEDAEKLRADLSKENSKTPAGKLQLSDSIKGVKLYGDLRLRYQYDQTTQAQPSPRTVSSTGANPTDAALGASPVTNQRSRERFRLRVGADVQATDTVFGGFGLATGQAADSNNETYTSGFDNYNIYINKAFIGWKPTPWFTLLGGKYENPLYTTDLVWDPDINPTGVSQIFDLTKALVPDNDKLSVQLIGNEFFFQDNDEFRTGNLGKDVFLYSAQLKNSVKLTPDVSITIAPGFNIFSGGSLSGLRNARALTDATTPNYTLPVQTQSVVTDTRQTTTTYDVNGIPTVTTTPINRTTAITITTPANGNKRSITTTTTVDQLQRKATGNAFTSLPNNGNFGTVSITSGVNKGASLQNSIVKSYSTAKGDVTITTPQPKSKHNEADSIKMGVLPGDVTFKLAGLKAKLFWDVAYNFAGKQRFNDVLGLNEPSIIQTQDVNYPNLVTTQIKYGQHYKVQDSLAWLIGFQLGENKKKGDWSFLVNYRETGVAAVDPNLNDSDINQSASNTRGIQGKFAYNLADSVTLGFSYNHGWALDRNLAGGFASTIADLKGLDVVQADLNWKF